MDNNSNDRQRRVRLFFNKILKKLFPEDNTCDICGMETFGFNLCPDCAGKVKLNDKNICPVCGRKTFRPEICMECKNKPPLFKKAVSAFLYEDGVTVLVSKFKNGRPYLKEFFADKIAERMTCFPKTDCITYVPLAKKSLYRRGYNQGRLLAKALSKRINIPVVYGAINREKERHAQKGLARKQRIENVKGAFKVIKRDKIKGKNVLLVDDILTTGSTVNEISRILLKAGAKNVYVATVASVEYKHPENSKKEDKNKS